MGLGIQLRASLSHVRDNESDQAQTVLFDKIKDAAIHLGGQSGLQRFVSMSMSEDRKSAWLNIHPAEETLDVRIEENYLIISARTSSCGPGYHAYIVHLIDFIAKSISVEWSWWDDEGDETGFYEDRDISKLQHTMTSWLRNVAGLVVRDIDKGLYVHVAMDRNFGPQIQLGAGEASTPLGFRSVEYFRQCLAASPEEIDGIGRDWFVWWNEECDACFWSKTGANIMWTRVPWRPPFAEQDNESYAVAEYCFKRAREQESGCMLPEADIEEMARFASSSDPWLKPRPDGIGYFRRDLRRPLPGGWTVRVPGYWRFDHTDDGTTYWFDEMTVEGSALRVEKKAERDFAIDELLSHDAKEVERVIRDRDAYVIEEKTYEHEGRQLPWIFGRIGRYERLLMLSVFLSDQSQTEYAKDIIRSVKFVEPQENKFEALEPRS